MSEKKPENPVEKLKALRSQHALRGGSWYNSPNDLRSAYRSNLYYPSDRGYNYGFRIARTVKK